VIEINVTKLDSIRHRLNHERDMVANVDVDVAADMDVDISIGIAVDMDIDMAHDVDVDSPCFHGPVSSGPNIYGLLII
jgi:hypothetical protein